MPEPSQLTIHGDAEPVAAYSAPQTCPGCGAQRGGVCRDTPGRKWTTQGCVRVVKAESLFTAPQTMRGQLAMPTDTVQR